VRIRSGTAKRAGLATTVLAVVLSLTACSGGDDDDDGAGPEPDPTEQPRVVTSQVAVGEVSGRLPPKRRDQVTSDVGKVVTTWIEAAYFSGSPRTRLDDAFPGFTTGAARLARRDKWLMSNASLAQNIDEVVPAGKVRVNVDLLAVKKHAVGATGRFRVQFDTVAGKTKRVTVRGRVALTRNERGNWTIFAYDAGRWAVTRKGERS